MNRLTLSLLILVLGIHSHEVKAMDAADAVSALVQGNTAFAVDLYARLSQGDGNLFVSPFSISTALAMTYVGAQEETAQQIAKALHFKLPPSQLHPAFHKLIIELHARNAAWAEPGRPADVELSTANALWSQAGEPHSSRLPKANRDQLPREALPGRFPGAPEEARRTINAWVETETGANEGSDQIDH